MQIASTSSTANQSQAYIQRNNIIEVNNKFSTNTRKSLATPNSLPSKSSRPMRDRRRSSGAISTHSQQKPRKCIGEYVVGKTLGKGASGRVKLGVHKTTGEQVAIKIISKSHLAANPAIEKAVRREIAIMKLIHHPNVMSLIDVIDDPASSDLYLVLEYVEGGELFEYLVSKGRLSENEARHHFQQIILGLDYCHHHLICHRDLKPENLLLNAKNNIKIADFGMASLQPLGSMLETSCGSPHYASPEIVAGLPYNGSACDIWSCGVILYALLTGHLPFDDENIRQLLKKVKSGKYIMPDNISRSAQELISQILMVDPSRRLTMDQIMAHPWFCETEPANMYMLPVPPTALEIGQPLNDANEIDDRLLETIKFLWGETNDETIIEALIQKEHNMQKVVYVLLQQHAERYWQADHDDESEDDDIDDASSDTPRRRYHTLGHRTERDRRCLSMVDPQVSSSKKNYLMGDRSSAPWLSSDSSKHGTVRRYSAATIRIDRPPISLDDLPANPPLPTDEKKFKLKKSETFYARFVKNVLSSSRRHTGKNKNHFELNYNEPADVPQEPNLSESPAKSATSTLAGTLRRKIPFSKPSINSTEFSISPSSMDGPVPASIKSNSKPTSHASHRNQVDPSEQHEVTNHSQQTSKSISKSTAKSATVSSKRLSVRLSNAFRGDSTVSSKKFGFTLGSGSKKQRKQLDLSLFQTEKAETPSKTDVHLTDSALTPPPMLSDGSTLSNSSSTSSNSQISGSYYSPGDAAFKGTPSALKSTLSNGSKHTTAHNNDLFTSENRPSQNSVKSIDRLNSNHSILVQQQQTRPATPSLLSNSSTLNSPGGPAAVSSNSSNSIPSQPAKSSWLNNLFFFKQPKVCSIVVNSTHKASILRSLHKLMNKETETRFYEKSDRSGLPRYKAEIKTKIDRSSKVRQVKCRIELITSDNQSCVVQFTQQQGDAMLLTTTIQHIRDALLREYPPSVTSFNQSDSAITSDTLIEE